MNLFKKWRLKSLIILALTGLPLATPGFAADAVKAEIAPLELSFETDERLFTILAWMHWVADRDEQELKEPIFAEEVLLKEHLKAQPLSAEMSAEHRKAYDNYLPGSSLYTKNGLLLLDSLRYGPAPDFAWSAAPAKLSHAQEPGAERRYPQLPKPELLRAFYQQAHLAELWQKLKPAHAQALEHYRPRAERLLKSAYQFLRVPLDVPVSYRMSLLGHWGILGQTSYSAWEDRYLIKLHFSPPKAAAETWQIEYAESENLRVMRHELTHALMNQAIKDHQHLLKPKLQKMGQALNYDWLKREFVEMRSPEWFADCMAYIDIEAELQENVLFYNHNPLFMHFIEQLPAYQASGKNYAEFLPELFKSFDPDKEIKRWQDITLKKQQAGEL